jgi:translocation protein SEC63
VQAVPLAARRNPGSFKAVVEGTAPLLQLPHMDADLLRKLFRKRLRTLAEMQQADPKERRDALLWAGLADEQVQLLALSSKDKTCEVTHPCCTCHDVPLLAALIPPYQ